MKHSGITKRIVSELMVLVLLALILCQQYMIFNLNELETDIDGVYKELDNIKCRIIDNSDRIFYLEEEVGTSYGESGEY